jgi:hypothetical protein
MVDATTPTFAGVMPPLGQQAAAVNIVTITPPPPATVRVPYTTEIHHRTQTTS